MSLARLLVRPVTILRAETTSDRYDNSVLDWTETTATETTGWLAQRSAVEVIDGRDALVTVDVLFLAAGTDLLATDRIVVDGTTHEVDGEPNHAWTPRGEHHLEVVVGEVVG